MLFVFKYIKKVQIVKEIEIVICEIETELSEIYNLFLS